MQLGRPDTGAGPGAGTDETTVGTAAPALASANPTPSVSPCIRPHVCRVGTKPNTNQPNPSTKPLRQSPPRLFPFLILPPHSRAVNIVVVAIAVVYAMVDW
jgi:hypothetical protein